MDNYITNNYLADTQWIDKEFKTERATDAYFFEFLTVNNKSYGCVFTTKRKGKFQCQKCRSIIDKKRYQKKCKRPRLSENINESSVESVESCREEELPTTTEEEANDDDHDKGPATFNLIGEEVKWLDETHVESCTLISQGAATSRSYKNLAVVYKSRFKVTSKGAYDSFKGFLSMRNKDVTGEDVIEGFQTFDKAKSALDKAGK